MTLAEVADLRSATNSFGAELDGADLRDPMVLAELGDVLIARRVVVVRGQRLTAAEQVAVARAIGEPQPAHPVVPGHPEHPEILVLDAAKGGKNARWHTDVTFVRTPPAASVLVADELPPRGGDTLWADLHGAYVGLAPAVRHLIDGLRAVHRISPLAYWGEPFDGALTRADAAELLERAQTVPPVVHPVVRVHPVSGERSLFVNPGFTSHLVGLSRIESESILRLLFEHSTQPEFVFRHRWQEGDVVLWDNRSTMHYAVDDFGDAPRRMRRVTVRGDAPVGPDGFESDVVDDPLVAVR
ncbi:MAG: TauD/TfdA dioxygenase family protein [Acidimicrobiia bacterium]